MRKVKEVLRLRFDLGLRQDQIARSCSIGRATVHRYLERATAAGLSWPLPEDCDDRRLNELLFPSAPHLPASSTAGWRRFRRDPSPTKRSQACDVAVALGRVSRNATGRVRLQPFLRVVPEVAPRSKRRDAAGPSSRRKDVGRLGRPHGAHLLAAAANSIMPSKFPISRSAVSPARPKPFLSAGRVQTFQNSASSGCV